MIADETKKALKIIQDLGYKLKTYGNYYTTQALYRSGDDQSLVIYPSSNLVIDFVTSEKFSIFDLIKKTLNLSSDEETTLWLKAKDVVISNIVFSTVVPRLNMLTLFPNELLKKLIPNHIYWINRGINNEILKLFQGGLVEANRMKNRYTFPIFNDRKEIIGFSGRTLINSPMKYKHVGLKSEWCYPSHLNKDVLEQKSEVILVEGIGCVLSLWECGIKNSLCLFGVSLPVSIINLLIRLNIKRIIIATNNDEKSKVGQAAAIKIQDKLKKYFDYDQIKIKLPPDPYKDFNEMLLGTDKHQSILNWYSDAIR